MLEENMKNTVISENFNEFGGIEFGFNSGGYETSAYAVTADGGVLWFYTMEKLLREGEVNFNDPDDAQWYVVGIGVNWEDSNLFDDHTGERIIPAYVD